MTIADRLASHVASVRPPSGALEDAMVDRLVHHLGLALLGHRTGQGDPAIAASVRSGRGGSHVVLGTSHRVSLLDAVAANSFLMRTNDLDDFQLPGGVHPGVVVLPAGLAVAELVPVSGADLLAALVAGYDVAGVAGRSTWTWSGDTPRRPGFVFGPLAAAATAARVLGLDLEATASAIGLSAHGASGIVEGATRYVYSQVAANGVRAALLAEAGVRAPGGMIEGEYGLLRAFRAPSNALDRGLDDLHVGSGVVSSTTKRYRASGLNLVPIELLRRMIAGSGGERVAKVVVWIPEARRVREEYWAYQSAHDPEGLAEGDMRAPLAMMLSGIAPSFDPPAAPPAADVAALARRIEMRYEAADRPITFARVRVEFADGRVEESEAERHAFPLHDPRAWLERCAGDAPAVGDLAEAITGLPGVADASSLVELSIPAGAAVRSS